MKVHIKKQKNICIKKGSGLLWVTSHPSICVLVGTAGFPSLMQQVSLLSIANPTSQAFPFPSWTPWGPGLARQREDIWRQVRAPKVGLGNWGSNLPRKSVVGWKYWNFSFKNKLLRNTFVSPQESLVAISQMELFDVSNPIYLWIIAPSQTSPILKYSRSIIYPSHPLQIGFLRKDSCFFWNPNLQFWEMREVVFFWGGTLEATIIFFGPGRQFFKQNKMKHHSLLPNSH